MRDYELVVLYHPDLEIDLDKALKKIDGLIKNSGGKVSFSDNWGKRRLAYTIKKQDYAIYVYYEIQLDPAAIGKLEGLLNITDEVIRYLVSKPTPNFGDRDKPTNVDEVEGKKEGEKPVAAKAKSDEKATVGKPSAASEDAKAKDEKPSSASSAAEAKDDKKAEEDKPSSAKATEGKQDKDSKEKTTKSKTKDVEKEESKEE